MNSMLLKIKFFFLLFLGISLQLWAQIPDGYYDSALGKKKAELKTALHKIIGKADVLDYGSGAGKTWSGFVQTDVDDEGYYVDMYSPNRVKANGNSAGSGMNIEHSFAKSWWGGTKNQAYKDIQQLRPSNSKANSSKGSWPMAIVDGKTTYDNGVIKVGKSSSRPGGEITAWEPSDQYKGDFARIYMYMVTCYENFSEKWTGNSVNQLDNNTYPVFENWTIKMLLEWCEKDPVDDWEIARNDKVYKIQGNRNPFVDHPELAEYIWGTKTDEAFYLGAGITNWQTGDYFVFPNSTIGESVEKSFRIEGIQIASAVSLILDGDDKNMFSFAVSSLSADEVNAGTDVGATYMPSSAGLHKATLMLAADNIASVAVELRGVSIPQTIRRIVPVGLKKEYSLNDSEVALKLSETLPGCTWEGDGVSANVFTPEKAGKGTHTLRWKSSSGCGSVQVVVK